MEKRNHIVLIILTYFLLTACKGNKEIDLSTVGNADLGNASWISTQEELPGIDSLLYEEHPSPIFRKEFTAEKDIRSATWYITSAGY
jgi:alpha-L-rhamnosidase